MTDGVPPLQMPLVSNPEPEQLEDTIALCLSGGGYRAMLFHLGTLKYLNDAKWLPKLDRISSVSGGSITSAVLATRWKSLTFVDGVAANFDQQITAPLRKMASTTIDVGGVLGGIFGRGSISDRINESYKKVLFGDATLQDFPDRPRFVINATSVQTGSLMRLSKPYIADWQVGIFPNPRLQVSKAVAASSAFPPILSPARIDFGPNDFSEKPGPCHRPPFTTRAILTDGGVYDNMGIETAWKRCRTILVSDAGAKLQPETDPPGDWARHALRINSLIDNQVRSLRKRQVVSAFVAGVRKGAYWGMFTDPSEYSAATALALPLDPARKLAETPTRLAAMDNELQERLINFGYGMAERALRSYVDTAAFKAAAFPYPRGIGAATA